MKEPKANELHRRTLVKSLLWRLIGIVWAWVGAYLILLVVPPSHQSAALIATLIVVLTLLFFLLLGVQPNIEEKHSAQFFSPPATTLPT